MRVVLFCHSLVSDWNHGNAHFLRGIATELISRGHEIIVYEPSNGWSLANLTAENGEGPVAKFHAAYPALQSIPYDLESLDVSEALDGADLVIAHEWNEPGLIRRLGQHRARSAHYRLLFHDTHHRSLTARDSIAHFDLTNYDGVLAFGEAIRERYLAEGWARRAWTWHEAADTRVFHPMHGEAREGDLVWIGNWGDEERSAELQQFLIQPVKELGLRARVYGVRYPEEARAALTAAGIEYSGWLPNYEVPAVFGRFRVTVHVPRAPYAKALRGVPTIRVFEALACGIPLICAPWDDVENLFTPGRDYLIARDGVTMKRHLRALLADEDLAREMAEHGRRTILARHTCAHRVDELMAICEQLGAASPAGVTARA